MGGTRGVRRMGVPSVRAEGGDGGGGDAADRGSDYRSESRPSPLLVEEPAFRLAFATAQERALALVASGRA